MRYIRSELLQEFAIVDPGAINLDTLRAAEVMNGTIDCLQVKDGIVNTAKIQDEALNKFFSVSNPFSTPVTLQRKDISSRYWTEIPGGSTDLEWTAPEDGVCMGALEYNVRVYTQTVTDPTFGWALAVYMDGALIGRTDMMAVQFMSGSLPFHTIATKGTHVFTVAINVLAYAASAAVDPEDVVVIREAGLWWRQAMR